MLPTQLMSCSARFVSNRGFHCYWLVVFLTFKLDWLLLKNINSKARASPDCNQTLTSLCPIKAYKFVHFVFSLFLQNAANALRPEEKGWTKQIYLLYHTVLHFSLFRFSFFVFHFALIIEDVAIMPSTKERCYFHHSKKGETFCAFN